MTNKVGLKGNFYRIITILLVVYMLIIVVPFVTFAADTKAVTGTMGDNITAEQTAFYQNCNSPNTIVDSENPYYDNNAATAEITKTSNSSDDTQMTSSTQTTWFILLLVLVSSAIGVIVFERKRQKKLMKRNDR